MTAPTPTDALRGNGFRVSYTPADAAGPDGPATALVDERAACAYILKGDHREAYAQLIAAGFSSCLLYYRAHIHEAHERSDPLPEVKWSRTVAAMPMHERASVVAEEVIGGGEISWGEALRLCYPEMQSGDLAPGADSLAVEALTRLTALWVTCNRPASIASGDDP